jgi:hypothetical protein
MAHGTPLGIASNDERYGAQGAFLIEAGISSSYHIASFFGLTEWIFEPKSAAKAASKEAASKVAASNEAAPTASKELANIVPDAATIASGVPDLSQVLWPRMATNRRPEPTRQPRRRAIDVSDVITRALTAAGLMK